MTTSRRTRLTLVVAWLVCPLAAWSILIGGGAFAASLARRAQPSGWEPVAVVVIAFLFALALLLAPFLLTWRRCWPVRREDVT